LVLWLDASTLNQSNHAPVTGLADLSGGNNSAIASRNPPTYNAPKTPGALHGRGTIHFVSGSGISNATGLQTVRRLGITGSQPRAVFAVLRRQAGHAMLINIGDTSTNGGYFGICDQSDHLRLPAGFFPPPNNGSMNRLTNSWHLLETIYDGERCRSYVNGGFLGALTLPFHTLDKAVEIGLRTPDHAGKNAARSDGDFAELLIYDQALDKAEQRRVEDYLDAKWFDAHLLSPQTPLVWLKPGLSGLTGFACNPAGDQLLLTRTEADQQSLWRLGAAATNSAVKILQGRLFHSAGWMGSNVIAYASGDLHHPGMVLADLSGHEQARLLERAPPAAFSVSPDGKKLLFLGVVSNEPTAAIWQYDLAAKKLRQLFSGVDRPSAYARELVPFHTAIRLPSGRDVECSIYPPAHFDRHRQYPLVLGNTVFGVAVKGAHGRLWAPGIATCGAFVVIINRGTWSGGIQDWGQNVMGVYQNLVRNPCIDANRVFLFGASAETGYMGKFMARSPGLWKGAILLNPTGLPDLSTSPPFQSRPKLLISAGEAEHEDDRLKKFQTDALNYGGLSEVIIHPGENHHLVGNAAQLERTTAMMRFIFEE
jgi:hypothetical protein